MQNDIAELLYRLKDNIRAVENEDGDPAFVLREIEADFLSLLELVKLFLISKRDSYYGYVFMNMNFQVNFHAACIAGIRLNTLPAVLEANPLLLCKFSLKEIIYVVCHEIDHVVLNHPAEMIKSNPERSPDVHEKLNLAMDASVNDRLENEISGQQPPFLTAPNGSITSGSLKKMFGLKQVDKLENYIYYYNLIKEKNNGEAQNGQNGMLGDHDWQIGDDAEDATATVRELLNAAVDMMNDEVRGLMPGSFMEQVKIVNRPPVITWQKLLKKYIGTISANNRKTRLKLNRRQPERFDLPGRADDKILKIVVAVDTSASVSDREISDIFTEIFAILAKRKHDITVIECDAKVQQVYKAKTVRDLRTKLKGRGGTAFTPVIEHINNDRYYRDALLIYFTDGYGEDVIPRPRTYRNIWVILGDTDRLSLSEPYGAKIAM